MERENIAGPPSARRPLQLCADRSPLQIPPLRTAPPTTPIADSSSAPASTPSYLSLLEQFRQAQAQSENLAPQCLSRTTPSVPLRGASITSPSSLGPAFESPFLDSHSSFLFRTLTPRTGLPSSATTPYSASAFSEATLPSPVPGNTALSPTAPTARQSLRRPVAPRDLGERLAARKVFDPVASALVEHRGTKRKSSATGASTELDAPLSKRPCRVRRDDQQKLDLLFWFLKEELNWTFGEMLYKSSLYVASRGSETQTKMLTHFFAGHDKEFPVSRTLSVWLKHPFGRHPPRDLMYCVDLPYTEIRQMRPALTSFSAQLVKQQLVREAEEAIEVKSGLHVSIGKKERKNVKPLVWDDLGVGTVDHVRGIIQRTQPLLLNFVSELCSRKPRRGLHGAVVVRKQRTVSNVATQVISSIDFTRSNHANLLPLATGVLHFACLAPFDIFRWGSRVGSMPSYSTINRALEGLATDAANKSLAFGLRSNRVSVFRFDNVHTYHLHRDVRVGRQNELHTGLFGAMYEAESYVDATAFNIADNDAVRKRGLRKTVTTRNLFNKIDQKHLNNVLTLQWLRVLVDYIPELADLSAAVTHLYRTTAAISPLPPCRTVVRPLACDAKNETHLEELRDFIQDMFSQGGLTPETAHNRLIPCGGDGMSYELLHVLKSVLRVEGTEWSRFENPKPMLEGWHQKWTEVCAIHEEHWGDSLTRDYSTLGHSASRLGRRRPADLKKVDFKQGTQLMFTVVDSRMLDCWRLYFSADDIFAYFADLKRRNKLPAIEELHDIAKKLCYSYMSQGFGGAVMSGEGIESSAIPIGEPWDGIVLDDSSKDYDIINQGKIAAHTGSAKSKARGRKKIKLATPMDSNISFAGDHALADSRLLMRSVALLRESILACAEGDPERILQISIVQLFQFAGCAHSKYTEYLLEMIIDLEYECTPQLRAALLQVSLVNLSGKPGGFAHGDLIQEYFNRLLDAVVKHKGVPRHCDPAALADMQILLQTYKDHELHTFRAGRRFSDDDHDRFSKGYAKLDNGKLDSYVTKSLARCATAPIASDLAAEARSESATTLADSGPEEADPAEDDESAEEDLAQDVAPLVFAEVVEGELILFEPNVQARAEELVRDWEAELGDLLKEGEGEEEESDDSDIELPEVDRGDLDETDEE
ncbi:uncharacterized protein SCHCODRAFT_02671332 [Schizophyllum commune H4-8]|nr:uncharacterized protein SCHCODRAFT_02671332 [Schizophyllum commune H4-8]KAI5888787.1 hypothetical protein SCHCODRAFT_02671332 [Schizophyllum commune H4-8]